MGEQVTAHDVRIDIGRTGDLTLGSMAATIHLPPPDQLPKRPTLVFAVPGGGYSRGYFDMRFAGHDGYSQAADHVAHGIVLVAIDHIGVGDSSTDRNDAIQFEHLAASYDRCCRAILGGLRSGTLIEGKNPIAPCVVIGIGQSMGGCVSILAQGAHATFDAIAVLGYSAIHTRLPQRDPAQEAANLAVASELSRGGVGRSPRDVTMQDYAYPFHWEDVPPDILAADMDGGYPLRRVSPPFGSATMPDCTVQMMIPAVVAAEAGSITVPVFIGNGARDVCPDPRAEPGAYTAATDITTVVVPQMAHMHNFASTRQQLWDRLASWYLTVAGGQPEHAA